MLVTCLIVYKGAPVLVDLDFLGADELLVERVVLLGMVGVSVCVSEGGDHSIGRTDRVSPGEGRLAYVARRLATPSAKA